MFLTLRAKILAGYLFVVLLLAGLGIYSVFSFRSFTTLSSRAFEQVSQADRSNLSIYESLIRLNEAELNILGHITELGKTVIAEEPSKINSEISAAEKIISSIPSDLAPRLAATFTKEEILWHQYQAQLPEFLRRASTDPAEARKFYDGVLIPTYRELTARNREVAAAISELFEQSRQLANEESEQAVGTVILITLLAIGSGILVSILLGRQVTKPLEQLRNSLKRLQQGDLGARLEVRGADELGEVTFEFNRMTERLERYEKLNIDRLVAEKSKSEAAILSFSEPLFLFDAEKKLVLANRSAEEILGCTEADSVGKPIETVFSKDLLEAVRKSVFQNEGPTIVELRINDKLKFYRISSVEITAPTTQHTVETVGTLIHFADITHFEELDRMKDDFLAKVSHEFRTPLTSIRMALDILANGKIGSLNEDQRELILTSRMDSERLTKLIRDLLSISRIQPEPLEKVEPLNAVAIITSIVASVKQQFMDKGVLLQTTMPNRVSVRMQPHHLESVLQNLLINALNFTPTAGTVTVTVGQNSNSWFLMVTDTGIGIPETDRSRIFERFVQLKPMQAATPGSIGLGLAIVKEIVELYRGTITVTSELGSGTAFRLEFSS